MSRPDRQATRAAKPELTPLEGRQLLTGLPAVRSLSSLGLANLANLRATTVAPPSIIQASATATGAATRVMNPTLVNGVTASVGSPLALSRIKVNPAVAATGTTTMVRSLTQPVAAPNLMTSRAATTAPTGIARFVAHSSALNHSTLNLEAAAGGGREKYITAREV